MSICQLHEERKSRKAGKRCHKCGREIIPPEGYRWWQGRYTPKFIRCLRDECTPAVWEREINPTRSDHLHAAILVDQAQNTDDPNTALSALNEAVDLVANVVETLTDRLAGWEGTGFEQSSLYDACTTSRDELEQWSSGADDWISSLDALIEDEGESDDMESLDDILADIEDLPDLDLGQ
jgi:hypothetical protein